MMGAAFLLTIAAFVTSLGYTMLALARQSDRHTMIGLGCMIACAVMAGNAAGSIAGGTCG